MKTSRWLVGGVSALLLATVVWSQPAAEARKVVLVVHGGAGAEPKEKMTPELERQYRAGLEDALRAGYDVLKNGGTSLDAVETAIKVLEDAPLFNAGKGAVFNREGRIELNASIMEGKAKRAGAVAGLSRVKNPIAAARLVMEKSDHVFLISDGAERFAREQGLTEVSPLYFWTERRWRELREAQEKERAKPTGLGSSPEPDGGQFGTVGAVALDSQGNLAAGTSTGGIMNKLPGRVGDSPIIGGGTYADNDACAVSCTGHGELFIRYAVAYDVAARVKYGQQAVADAAEHALKGLPKGPRPGGGVGGLIALDRQGRFATPFNTNGMYRGHVTSDGKIHTAIYER